MNRRNWKIITPFLAGVLFLCAAVPAYADSGIAMVFAILFYAGIIAVILIAVIETIALRILGGLSWIIAFVCMLCINIASTFIGFIIVSPFTVADMLGFSNIDLIPIVIGLLCISLLLLHARSTGKYLVMIAGIAVILAGYFGEMAVVSVIENGTPSDFLDDLALLAEVIYMFGVTLAVETWVGRLFIKLENLDKAIFWANLIPYVVAIVALLWYFSGL